MKSIKLLSFFMFSLVLCCTSCKKDDPCENITCQNGGTCTEGVCDCPNGFSGSTCQIEDLCTTQNVVCQNGGNCVSGTCECPDGYTGTNCEIEIDPCEDIICQNDGTCVDGICECPDGYTGTNCESFDDEWIQSLLDGGQTPIDIYNMGLPLESLYGKLYQGGLIFYLNTTDGTGFVAAEDEGDEIWGCMGTDISGLNNVITDPPASGEETEEGARIGDGEANTDAILADCTSNEIAAQLCRDLGPEWFLPSRGELNLMFLNLHSNGHGGFSSSLGLASSYSTSTEYDDTDSWSQSFFAGSYTHASKEYLIRGVRPAKSF